MRRSMLRKVTKPTFYGKNQKQLQKPKKPLVNRYHEYLYGVMPIQLALHANKRKIYNLYMKLEYGKEKDRKNKLTKILNLWNKQSKDVIESSTDLLDKLVKNNPHQGVVLEVDPLEIDTLDFLTQDYKKHFNGITSHEYPLWVALDQVQDPQNLGAIIRSCVYYGVHGIVVTDVKSAPINETVSKVSAGALEIANIYYPGNMGRFLKGSHENGWRVIGTDLSDQAINISKHPEFLTLTRPTILVLGSEGHGIRKGVLEACPETIKINPQGVGEHLGSMNVSATTAALLHHLTTFKH